MAHVLHSKKVQEIEKNIWVEFSQLAVDYKAVNLGQGFPDFAPPAFVRDAIAAAINGGHELYQYTRGYGHPRLVKSLAKFFSRVVEHEIDPMEDIVVTVGAYEALFCTFQGLIHEGDEVIVIEPFFDCYRPNILMARAIGVYIPLRPKDPKRVVSSGDWVLSPDELASKITARTKAIIFNTPNNPLGKVFKLEELQMIADLCIKHNLLCFSDEVYEWMAFDGNKHIKISTLPGMWERTITIGSAGKTFSATGWKVGWAIGPSNLIKSLKVIHQNSVYTCPTITQEAVAIGFEREYELYGTPESYFHELPAMLFQKREKLATSLTNVGLTPILPEGGYYMILDISFANKEVSGSSEQEPHDYRFGKWLIKEKGLVTIPVSSFYCPEHAKEFDKYVRLCIVKEDSTLEAAQNVLTNWFQKRTK